MSTDTITQDELTEALKQIGIYTGPGLGAHYALATYPEALAYAVFQYTKDHREPEYEIDSVYQDAYGEVWQYTEFPEGDKGWRSFTDDPVQFHVPKRPLKKLVPEDTAPPAPPEELLREP